MHLIYISSPVRLSQDGTVKKLKIQQFGRFVFYYTQ